MHREKNTRGGEEERRRGGDEERRGEDGEKTRCGVGEVGRSEQVGHTYLRAHVTVLEHV